MANQANEGISESLSDSIQKNARWSELKLKLQKRSPLNLEEITLVNVVLQGEALEASKKYSESAQDLVREANTWSKRLSIWTGILAFMTAILAVVAIIQICA